MVIMGALFHGRLSGAERELVDPADLFKKAAFFLDLAEHGVARISHLAAAHLDEGRLLELLGGFVQLAKMADETQGLFGRPSRQLRMNYALASGDPIRRPQHNSARKDRA
jgi:hypothetical protein